MNRCHLPLLITLCFAASPLAGQTPPQGRLLFLGIAYDEAPPPGSTADNFSYAPDNFRLQSIQTPGVQDRAYE